MERTYAPVKARLSNSGLKGLLRLQTEPSRTKFLGSGAIPTVLAAAEPKGRGICKNSEVFLLPLVQPELHAEGRLKGRNRDCRRRLRTRIPFFPGLKRPG